MKTIIISAALFLAVIAGTSTAQAYEGHHSYWKNHHKYVWVNGHKIYKHHHAIWIKGHFERVS